MPCRLKGTEAFRAAIDDPARRRRHRRRLRLGHPRAPRGRGATRPSSSSAARTSITTGIASSCRRIAGRTWPIKRLAWLPLRFHTQSPPTLVSTAEFQACVNSTLQNTFSFAAADDGEIDAVRISGDAHLTRRTRLGATGAFNGDKIVPIDRFRVRRGQSVIVDVRGTLGAGLASLQVLLS
jgi:hypothetical protein